MANLFTSDSKVKFVEERVVKQEGKKPFKLITFANTQTYERMTFITDADKVIAPLYTEGILTLNCGEYKGRTSFTFESFIKA